MSKQKIISSLVEIEAKRVEVEKALKPNPILIAQGWKRRFLSDSNRAAEAIDLYTELGFEVYTENVDPEDFNDACKDCGLTTLVPLLSIYTRKVE